MEACQIDQWLDVASCLAPGAEFEAGVSSVNDYLAFRTVLVGYSPSIADLACWGYLVAGMQWDGLRKKGTYAHLARWHNFLVARHPQLDALAIENGPPGRRSANAKSAGKTDSKGSKKGQLTGTFDIGLTDAAEGKVVTRFPPEPSGYLHIGHAKAALLNQYFATQYKGRLLVRFDDTNPSKENDEYVQSIITDIHRLGLKHEPITYTSDYFPQMQEMAELLIKAGHMYADDTPVDQMREERMHGIESKCRNRSVQENMRIFQEMMVASEEGLRNCMRIKMDMTAANKALRDPVAYRCNLTHHWRTGETYKVYPTYDFACPFVDSLEGVTHALRTSEYTAREAQFQWMLKLMQSVKPELKPVHIWEYSRLAFVHTLLSKRKLTWFVEAGIVSGWDDPRMPTVQGMLRRGLQVEALKEFMLAQGASKNVTVQEWDKIWNMNKRIIDPVCPRHTAVEVEGMVPVSMAGAPDPPETIEVPKHLKHPPAGIKLQIRSTKVLLDQADAVDLAEGEEATMMAWGNAVFEKKLVDGSTGSIVSMEARLHLEGDFKKTRLKLTWLADTHGLPLLKLHFFGYLITKKKIEEEDNFEDFVNRNSEKIVDAIGDVSMKDLTKGEVIQLERKGYFIVDVPFVSQEQPIVLFNIPDGRSKAFIPGITE